METYTTILNSAALVGIIILSYIILKQSKENDKLQEELDEKTAEAKAWKTLLKKYIDERK